MSVGSYSFWNHFVLPLYVASRKPDLMVYTESMVPSVRLSRKSVVIVYDAMYLRVRDMFDKKSRMILERVVPHALRVSDVVVTISESSKSDLVDFYKVEPSKVWVIYPSVSTKFRPLDSAGIEEIKKRYNIYGDYILFVGTHHQYKNLKRLVEAFSVVLEHSDLRNLRLLIIGSDGNATRMVKATVAQLNLTGSVTFLGYVPPIDLPPLIAASKLFVLPSLYEGFGIPLLEAMACGVPVVTSNVSSMPEVVGDAGAFFNPLDVDDIAQTIINVLDDRGLYNSMAEKGISRAKLFNWRLSGQKLIELFNTL